MQVEAVIFDMDGMLVDTLPIAYQALQEMFDRYAGRKYSREEMNEMFGPSMG